MGKRTAWMVAMCLCMTAPSCSQRDPMSEKMPFQHGKPVAFDCIAFRDSKGLGGTTTLWISATGEGILQVAGRPPKGKSGRLWEKRFSVMIPQQVVKDIETHLGAHNVLQLRMPTKKVFPDTGIAVIGIRPSVGDAVVLTRMGSDSGDVFDALLDYALKLCDTLEKKTLLYEGEYDGTWAPECCRNLW